MHKVLGKILCNLLVRFYLTNFAGDGTIVKSAQDYGLRPVTKKRGKIPSHLSIMKFPVKHVGNGFNSIVVVNFKVGVLVGNVYHF